MKRPGARNIPHARTAASRRRRRLLSWRHLSSWFCAAGLICVLLVGCDAGDIDLSETRFREVDPPEPAVCPTAEGNDPDGARVEVHELARGLDVPWGIAPTPDGRILVTERSGRIRVIVDGELGEAPWAEDLPVTAHDEGGLMGIALHPEFERNGYVYFAALRDRSEYEGRVESIIRRVRARLGDPRALPWVVGVYRLTDESTEAGGRGVDLRVVVDGLPSLPLHAGGALHAVGPDQLLLSLGDGFRPALARDPTDPRGKILRIPLDPETGLAASGGLPEPVAHGVRNSQGIAALDDGRTVFFIDHGPTGLDFEGRRQGKDELNVLAMDEFEAGAVPDFGWPVEAGIHASPRYLPPLMEWTLAIAPAGLALRGGDGGPDSTDAELWVTGLRGQVLVRVEVVHDGEGDDGSASWRVRCVERVLDGGWGRLRAATWLPDGTLLVATSNRDGRGTPRDGDDRILRLRIPDEE